MTQGAGTGLAEGNAVYLSVIEATHDTFLPPNARISDALPTYPENYFSSWLLLRGEVNQVVICADVCACQFVVDRFEHKDPV